VKTIICAAVIAAVAAPGLRAQVAVGARVGSDVAASNISRTGYDDGGRRDPFVTLIVPKRAPGPATGGRPATGLGALSVNDVTVTGVVKAGAMFVAMLRSPDGKSFAAKRQDHLQDGVVKSIDADGVVFVQQMADALGVVRPREVRKPLRSSGAQQ
jgi:hypothetical protein